MTFRNLARASAAGLLAAGALAVAATPALAADVDFGLELKGSTIALGVGGKPATVSFKNLGTTTPKQVLVQFDASDLKPAIGIDLGECTFEDGIAECELDKKSIPGPGETADLDVPLVVKDPGERGKQGKLTITVSVDGDTNDANDSKTVEVLLSERAGADLRVIAHDVSQVDSNGKLTGKAIPPGGKSLAIALIANRGSLAAVGLKVEVKLPEQVTFVSKEEGCEYAANMRAVTCSFEDALVFPWGDSADGNEQSAFNVPFEVRVSEDAKGPVSLAGGSWTVAALGSEEVSGGQQRIAAPPAAKLPAFARAITPEEIAEFDVDASDNTDGFAVLVAGPDGGAGGGNGDDDNGGGLPVTGPVAASVAGAGVAVLAVGAFLFVSARRRRIVLVTPTDGK